MSNFEQVRDEVLTFLDVSDVIESLGQLSDEDRLSAANAVQENRLLTISNALAERISREDQQIEDRHSYLLAEREALDTKIHENRQVSATNRLFERRARGLTTKREPIETKREPIETTRQVEVPSEVDFAPVTLLLDGFHVGEAYMSGDVKDRYVHFKQQLVALITPTPRSSNNILPGKVMTLLRKNSYMTDWVADGEVEVHYNADRKIRAISFPKGTLNIVELAKMPSLGDYTVKALFEFLQKHTA